MSALLTCIFPGSGGGKVWSGCEVAGLDYRVIPPTSLTTPNEARPPRRALCQKVRNTTALTEKSCRRGRCGATSAEITMYSCSRQYIAIDTEIDTMVTS